MLLILEELELVGRVDHAVDLVPRAIRRTLVHRLPLVLAAQVALHLHFICNSKINKKTKKIISRTQQQKREQLNNKTKTQHIYSESRTTMRNYPTHRHTHKLHCVWVGVCGFEID